MVPNVLRSLWSEPRVPDPPRRVWRDWELVGVLVALAVVEGFARTDLVWWPWSVVVQLPLLVMLLWRRTRPLLSVAVAFGGIGLLDLATTCPGRGRGRDHRRRRRGRPGPRPDRAAHGPQRPPDIEVVGEAADGAEAVALARRLPPDVCLFDIRMPRLDGIEATEVLAGPGVTDPIPIVVPTTFDLDEEVLVEVARGHTDAEIAEDPFLSLSTVETHVASLMAKLATRNRVEIGMWAHETGRLGPPPPS